MKEAIKKSLVGGLIFSLTSLTVFIVYATIGSTWTNPTTLEVGAGSGLSASSWNKLLENFNNLDGRVNNLNTRPVFSAYLNQASSGPINIWTKVPFNAVEYDTHSFFNTTTNRFQPTIAGYYNINLSISMTATAPTGSTMYICLNKNGATIRMTSELTNYTSLFSQSQNIDTIVYMNGTTDYLDAYYMYNANTVNLVQGLTYTYIQGYYLRP